MRKQTAHLLKALRSLMHKEGLAAYLVPSTDAHNSEYLAACHQRRAFLSGFDGSAGVALVTQEKALLWTDGR
jgi:Xaa-Pro aminopeptidase